MSRHTIALLLVVITLLAFFELSAATNGTLNEKESPSSEADKTATTAKSTGDYYSTLGAFIAVVIANMF